MTSPSEWRDMKRRIEAAGGSLAEYLTTCDRAELVRLMWDGPHRRNLFSEFAGETSITRAEKIVAEIERRTVLCAVCAGRGVYDSADMATGQRIEIECYACSGRGYASKGRSL